MSLRNFLTRLICLCIGPLILLAISLAILNVMNKLAERDIEAANLVNSFSVLIEQHLHARISALHMLAASPLVDDASRREDLYRESQGFYQGFGSHVILADAEMHMLFNTRAPFGSRLPMLPRPRGHAAAPTALETGQPAVGDVFFGPIAKEPLVAIAVPARRMEKTVFILLTIFETRQFQERLDKVALPSGWSLALLDGRNEVIASRASSGLKSWNDDGGSNYFIVKSKVSPWSVVLKIPHGIYSPTMIGTASALAITILIAVLVSILGGTLVSRRLGKAVASLTVTPAPGTPPPTITEIASVRALLDEAAEKREHYEEDLRLSEEKYRTVADFTYDWETWTDAENKFKYVSPSCERITGYTVSDFMENNHLITDITHPADKAVTMKHFSENIFNPDACHLDFRIITKSGEERWISHFCRPIYDRDGKPIGRRGSNRDITDRKRAEDEKQALEERLNRAEKMEALGLLAGGVAHDLNNLIGIIVGYAELMSEDIDESSPMRASLLNIMDGGHRAAAVVQDLLTLARRGVAGRKVININRIILDFIGSSEWGNLHSRHPHVQLKIDLENDLLNISASPVHLQKTLFNLVSNATEAMPQGGLLTIKTANQYLDKPVHGYDNIREGDYVILSVSDTGDGIAEQDLNRIFEPFYTRKIMGRSGTGLGLAVVWGTVKDHQGYIDVESKEGKGTILTLYFPVSREDIAAETVSVSLSEYMGRGESILVVDDVKGQRDLATAMLKKLNYNVASVSSGEEALQYLKKNQVDLMVLDMIMEPGMDGLDTYKKALEIHPKQKAIIVSGFSESNRVHDAQVLGAGEYVKKPYIQENLGMAVKKELERLCHL